jgi:hypothetical protein
MRPSGKIMAGAMIVVVAAALPAIAQERQIAQVKTTRGDASIVRGGARIAAKPGDAIYEGDVIETGANGTIGLTFIDNTVFSTGPDSHLALQQFRFDSGNFRGEMQAEIQKGSLSVVTGDITRASPGAMKIKTPTAVLGVRGTTFAVKVY